MKYCTGKEWDTCRVEKMGCKGCHYNEIEKEKLELILFMVVRNSQVLPKGNELGKTQKEITHKTKEVIKELQNMIDYKKAKELYELEV